MPLGEFQEDMHLCEGLPLTSQLKGAMAADLVLRGTELLPIQPRGPARHDGSVADDSVSRFHSYHL